MVFKTVFKNNKVLAFRTFLSFILLNANSFLKTENFFMSKTIISNFGEL